MDNQYNTQPQIFSEHEHSVSDSGGSWLGPSLRDVTAPIDVPFGVAFPASAAVLHEPSLPQAQDGLYPSSRDSRNNLQVETYSVRHFDALSMR